jgi:hypothetical protein
MAAVAKGFFAKTMQDMVKGIRNAKDDGHDYIQQCIAECKAELKGRDLALKSHALSKLTYVSAVPAWARPLCGASLVRGGRIVP